MYVGQSLVTTSVRTSSMDLERTHGHVRDDADDDGGCATCVGFLRVCRIECEEDDEVD